MSNLSREHNGKLYCHPNAQCHLETDGEFVIFYSYETPILYFNRGSKDIRVKFDANGKLYSVSTARQVTWALYEFVFVSLTSQDLYKALKAECEVKNLSIRDYLERYNREIVIKSIHAWSF